MLQHLEKPINKPMKSSINIIIGLFVLFGCNQHKEIQKSKEFSDKVLEFVLTENEIGQEYFFKKILKNEVLEYVVTYLGVIKTKDGDSLRFVNSTIYSGLYEDSKRANSRLFIYNAEREKLGYYYVGGALYKPIEIINDSIFFPLHDASCNQTTAICFRDSIPKEIFINCSVKGGDLYSFEKE